MKTKLITRNVSIACWDCPIVSHTHTQKEAAEKCIEKYSRTRKISKQEKEYNGIFKGLPASVRNALRGYGIKSIEELQFNIDNKILWKVPNLGEYGRNLIDNWLKTHKCR